VAIEDSLNNVVTTDTSQVTLSLNNSNAWSAALTGTTQNGLAVQQNAVSGVASFTDLKVDHWGAYSLHAVDGSLPAKDSTGTFNITGSQLVFTGQPTNTTHGAPITPAVTVAIEDSLGNVVDDSATMIGVAIDTNPGTPAGTLTGGGAVAASHGTATFAGLSIDNTGTGYTLKATGGGLTSSPSSAFNIT
jgi:hypothetical protein